jgi:uncharacterized protein (TIGR02145 family)
MKENIKILIALSYCMGWFINANAQTVTDIDGNVYKTVKIGSQFWMLENLKTAHYSDGSPITELELKTPWADAKTGAWCYYQSNDGNNPTYGKLYNWYAVTDKRKLCPTGWHVPSDDEWTLLTDYLGGDQAAGGKMKATTLWNDPNTDADNSSGFTALPAGTRSYDGTFYLLGFSGLFWSSTEDGSNTAWYRYLYSNFSKVFRNYNGKGSGLSVRCVGD